MREEVGQLSSQDKRDQEIVDSALDIQGLAESNSTGVNESKQPKKRALINKNTDRF